MKFILSVFIVCALASERKLLTAAVQGQGGALQTPADADRVENAGWLIKRVADKVTAGVTQGQERVKIADILELKGNEIDKFIQIILVSIKQICKDQCAKRILEIVKANDAAAAKEKERNMKIAKFVLDSLWQLGFLTDYARTLWNAAAFAMKKATAAAAAMADAAKKAAIDAAVAAYAAVKAKILSFWGEDVFYNVGNYPECAATAATEKCYCIPNNFQMPAAGAQIAAGEGIAVCDSGETCTKTDKAGSCGAPAAAAAAEPAAAAPAAAAAAPAAGYVPVKDAIYNIVVAFGKYAVTVVTGTQDDRRAVFGAVIWEQFKTQVNQAIPWWVPFKVRGTAAGNQVQVKVAVSTPLKTVLKPNMTTILGVFFLSSIGLTWFCAGSKKNDYEFSLIDEV